MIRRPRSPAEAVGPYRHRARRPVAAPPSSAPPRLLSLSEDLPGWVSRLVIGVLAVLIWVVYLLATGAG